MCSITQSCPPLCNPMDCSPSGFCVHEISQARTLEQVAICYSRRSSWPRDRIWIYCVSCIGRQVLYHWATWVYTCLYTKLHGLKWCQFSSIQLLSCVRLCDPMDCSMTGLPVYHQLRNLPKPISIMLVMPSSHLILCCPLLLLPSIFPSIRVFSNESALPIRWPKY